MSTGFHDGIQTYNKTSLLQAASYRRRVMRDFKKLLIGQLDIVDKVEQGMMVKFIEKLGNENCL